MARASTHAPPAVRQLQPKGERQKPFDDLGVQGGLVFHFRQERVVLLPVLPPRFTLRCERRDIPSMFDA